MGVIISITLISVILAYVSSKARLAVLFKLAFVMVTVIEMIHYNYGSDYMQYYNQHFLYTGTISDFIRLSNMGYGAYRSIGWAVLNSLFPGEIGFFLIVALISLIENYIYYLFICQNVERKDWWKSFSIYVFMTNLYIINFSALRQGLAVALVTLSMMMVGKKKPLYAMAITVIACSFHSSAMVMIPFVLLSMAPLVKGKEYARCISIISIILFISNTIASGIFTRLVQVIPYISKQYGVYFGNTEGIPSLGIGFALRLVMFCVLINFMATRFKQLPYEQRVFLILSCIDICIIPFQVKLSGMISRIEYYFLVFQVVSVPVVYARIKNTIIRIFVSLIYILLLLLGYYRFLFVTEWSATSYRHFHTIFEVLLS